jgi:hypothetical protein
LPPADIYHDSYTSSTSIAAPTTAAPTDVDATPIAAPTNVPSDDTSKIIAILKELIATQKWISLYFNDLQAWHEWKRTGIPVLKPSLVNNNGNVIPVRFRYPTDQQVTNRSNYTAAVARQGADDINTQVWWDK